MSATITRTDIHRPASPEFDPAAYDLVAVYDLGGKGSVFVTDEDEQPYPGDDDAPHPTDGGFAAHQRDGRCGHCGTPIRYAALLTHRPTDEMIYVGETCLDQRFDGLTKGEFQRLRKAAALRSETARERPLRDARIEYLIGCEPCLADLTYPNVAASMGEFFASVGEQLRTTGRLSDRQIESVGAAFERHIEREAKRAADAALPSCPAPEGKIEITGEIVHVKVDIDYSHSYNGTTTYKMIVRDDRGFKVWSTIPTGIRPEGSADTLKGSRVTLTTTLTRSERDESFAFGKRPTRARLVAA